MSVSDASQTASASRALRRLLLVQAFFAGSCLWLGVMLYQQLSPGWMMMLALPLLALLPARLWQLCGRLLSMLLAAAGVMLTLLSLLPAAGHGMVPLMALLSAAMAVSGGAWCNRRR